MGNPILLGKAEVKIELEIVRQQLTKKLVQIGDILPDTYTSITLICRTDKPNQQIILSNVWDTEEDIKALKSAILDAPSTTNEGKI